jgi:hypothetical protein
VKFELNKTFETENPLVDVDAGLAPGTYRFRLVVFSQRGQRSRPVEVDVNVLPRGVTPLPIPIPIGPRPLPDRDLPPSHTTASPARRDHSAAPTRRSSRRPRRPSS